MRFTDEQISSLFEKHSAPNNDFEPVLLMNEQQFAAAIREAIEQASQHKAICDCGDSIEPETGAVCGNCASETQGNLERLIEAKQASRAVFTNRRQHDS